MQQISQGASLTQQVTTMLRAAITAGEMRPDEHYSAVGLSGTLGVSRTPVREALQLLEKEGIVRIEKNRGVRVLQISLEDIVQIFEIRLLLEPPMAGRGAAEASAEQLSQIHELHQRILERAADDDGPGTLKADKDFHLFLLGLAGNHRLVTMVDELRNLVLTRGLVTIPQARTALDLARDRNDILGAVDARDPAAAEAAMRNHVLNTARLLITAVCDGNPKLSAAPYLERIENLRVG